MLQKRKHFKRRKKEGQGSHKEKKGLFLARLPSFGRRQWSVWWITSLVLAGKFQTRLVKITFLGEAETAVRLGIKSWFVDVGFSTGDSILGLLSPF